MSWINDRLESRLRAVRQDERLRPAIDAVKAAGARPGVTGEALLDVALVAARDSYARSVHAPTADQIRERALLAAAAASAEQGISLAGLPAGTDKARHFFLSGWLALQLARAADTLLPRRLAEPVGVAGSVAIGFLKEVYDAFFATGFSREDLQADTAGARAALAMGRLA
ncbi:MAG: hypothetical protein VKS61_11705 [Candidatus Sericytochromatia bacterium]|nr:hypothetical protein [Candidatus Sericytochromatia bacterium]